MNEGSSLTIENTTFAANTALEASPIYLPFPFRALSIHPSLCFRAVLFTLMIMRMRQSRAATLLLAQTRPKATMILRDTTALPMSALPAQRTCRVHPFQCEQASSCLQPYLQQNSSARHSRHICAIQTANNAKLQVVACPCHTAKLGHVPQQWIPNAAFESARPWSSLPRQPQAQQVTVGCMHAKLAGREI